MITKQVYTPYTEHARWHLRLGLFGLRMGGNGLSEMAKYSSFVSAVHLFLVLKKYLRSLPIVKFHLLLLDQPIFT